MEISIRKVRNFFLLLIGVVLISGCIGQVGGTEKDKAIKACVEKCQATLAAGQDLTNGPCLLNPIEELPDWVCDVAHSPRQPVDNLPENQCSAFREGLAKHFVEVNPGCNFIKAV